MLFGLKKRKRSCGGVFLLIRFLGIPNIPKTQYWVAPKKITGFKLTITCRKKIPKAKMAVLSNSHPLLLNCQFLFKIFQINTELFVRF